MSRKLYADIPHQIPRADRLKVLQASLVGNSILISPNHSPNRVRLQRMVWHNEILHIEACLKENYGRNP